MGKINVLDFEIANLIAAGEVVERPSSVLKELIENSIDSGATKIVAEIKKGGVSLIRVTDNGCGMDKEDLPVALKRHATSKIRSKDDLDGIITLGFRGEALAAISSVSEVTIITKTKDSPIGNMLTSDGGNILDLSEVGAADGTTVVVENLFFNVPARRKFLKKDSTEAMNVSALVEKVALSRPDISIQLLIDGEEKFCTPGDGKLINAIYAVFGKDFSSKLIECDGTADGIRVHGYIGRSDNARKNRNQQNVFINGRYVKSMTCMAAIEKGYTSFIAPECFPVCVLFLEINPKMVDVNVHPAKLEVKFTNEQPVFEAVYYTVKSALEEHEYRPEITFGREKKSDRNSIGSFIPIGEKNTGEQLSFKSEAKTSGVKDLDYKDRYSGENKSYNTPIKVSSPSAYSSTYSYNPERERYSYSSELSPKSSVDLLEKYKKAMPASSFPQKSEVSSEQKTSQSTYYSFEQKESFEQKDYKIIGEAFDCYVFVEYQGELLVIDKHAAHERVIFEDLKKNREEDGRVASQSLLLPITAFLTDEELSAVCDYKDDFNSIGFEFVLGERNADITSIPDAISASDAENLFITMADEIVKGAGNPEISEKIRREKALYQIACKAAIKGGRRYDSSVIVWLVDKVLSLPDITVCPHGRPIAYKLTKNELDRQFDRIK